MFIPQVIILPDGKTCKTLNPMGSIAPNKISIIKSITGNNFSVVKDSELFEQWLQYEKNVRVYEIDNPKDVCACTEEYVTCVFPSCLKFKPNSIRSANINEKTNKATII